MLIFGRAPSAGMNVLSQFLYSALASQGVTSSQALADPFNRYITLDENFVSISNMHGQLDDPHFVTRDRMGRDLAFMCRVNLNGWSAMPRDIAIDEQRSMNKPRCSSTAPVTPPWWASAPCTSCKLPPLPNSAKPKRRSPITTSPSTASTPPALSVLPNGPALTGSPTP